MYYVIEDEFIRKDPLPGGARGGFFYTRHGAWGMLIQKLK
jgi:hypothetical protein